MADFEATLSAQEADDAVAVSAGASHAVWATTEADDAVAVTVAATHAVVSVAEADDAPAAEVFHDWTAIVDDQKVREFYVCDVVHDTLATIRVPISSWQATVQRDRAGFVQAVLPAADAALVDSLRARAAGEFVIRRGAELRSGRTIEQEMARSPLERIRWDEGPQRSTATVRGNPESFGGAAVTTAYWPLDEASGSEFEDIISQWTGRVVDDTGTVTEAGQFGRARDLGASGSRGPYLRLWTFPANASLEWPQWTLGGWLYHPATSNWPWLWNIGNGRSGWHTVQVMVDASPGDQLLLLTFNDNGSRNGADRVTLPAVFWDAWHLVLVACDGQGIFVEVDGVRYTTDLPPVPLNPQIPESWFGSDFRGAYGGRVDDLFMTARYLPLHESAILWNGGAGRPAADLFFGGQQITRTLSGIRSLSSAGTQRARTSIDWFLRPGHQVQAGRLSFEADFINYIVTENDQYMDVGTRG